MFLRFHDIPVDIISDRDSKFTSRFWETLMELHGTKISLTSAFRPQSDGQTEICNKFIQEYLKLYIGNDAREWSQYIGTMERAYNQRVHSSHGMTPFEVDTGRKPRTITSIYIDTLKQKKEIDALRFKEKLDADLLVAQESLAKAQMRMQKYFNRNRKEQVFNVGDMVLLSTKNLSLPHLLLKKDETTKRKLAPRYIGPFVVVQRAATPDTYKIDLPPQLQLHPEFHTSMLKPWFVDPDPKRRSDLPPMIDANGDVVYIIEKLVAKRMFKKKTQYKVRWLGYPPSEDTWEYASNLGSVVGLIEKFETKKSNTSKQ
jgi:Chromo (CHRromatin Organisation MOdifier) domain